jgi:hypothetical protein
LHEDGRSSDRSGGATQCSLQQLLLWLARQAGGRAIETALEPVISSPLGFWLNVASVDADGGRSEESLALRASSLAIRRKSISAEPPVRARISCRRGRSAS